MCVLLLSPKPVVMQRAVAMFSEQVHCVNLNTLLTFVRTAQRASACVLRAANTGHPAAGKFACYMWGGHTTDARQSSGEHLAAARCRSATRRQPPSPLASFGKFC